MFYYIIIVSKTIVIIYLYLRKFRPACHPNIGLLLLIRHSKIRNEGCVNVQLTTQLTHTFSREQQVKIEMETLLVHVHYT